MLQEVNGQDKHLPGIMDQNNNRSPATTFMVKVAPSFQLWTFIGCPLGLELHPSKCCYRDVAQKGLSLEILSDSEKDWNPWEGGNEGAVKLPPKFA